MCGPPNCLLCERNFFSKLKGDRLTQIWTLIWVPLVILWFVYVGYSFDKLLHAEQDRSFQVELDLKQSITEPSFCICPQGVPLTTVNCTFHNDAAHPFVLLPATDHPDGCKGFNENTKSQLIAKFPNGSISCEVGFNAGEEYKNLTKKATVLLYDAALVSKVHPAGARKPDLTPLKKVPSGICAAELLGRDSTMLFWKRSIYKYYKGSTSVGYDLIDYAEEPSLHPITDLVAQLYMNVGDYYETTYKEVQWYTGYDFWYWMGMIGGFSFLLLMIHSVAFIPFKRLLGGDDDSTVNYISERGSASDSYSSSSAVDTESAGSGRTSNYGAL